MYYLFLLSTPLTIRNGIIIKKLFTSVVTLVKPGLRVKQVNGNEHSGGSDGSASTSEIPSNDAHPSAVPEVENSFSGSGGFSVAVLSKQ